MSVAPWQLTLFGRVNLRGDDGGTAESILVQPKHVGLLAYLEVESCVLESQHFSRRDHLTGIFWPELDQTHARTALRRVVHQIRAALGNDVLLSRGDEELALNGDLVQSDVSAFNGATTQGHFARALELYRGDLMPGFFLTGCAEFERWLNSRRDHFRQEAGACAWTLAQRLEADSEFSKAGQVARRAVRFSWDDERMLRRALGMLERLGDRSGALRLYDEFARRMREEYNAKPAPETVALANRLRGLD